MIVAMTRKPRHCYPPYISFTFHSRHPISSNRIILTLIVKLRHRNRFNKQLRFLHPQQIFPHAMIRTFVTPRCQRYLIRKGFTFIIITEYLQIK